MYSPVASQAVAIQKIPSCVWHRPADHIGQYLGERQAEECLALDGVVRRDRAHDHLDSSRPATTKKYLRVASIEGVGLAPSSGSLAGATGGAGSCWAP